MTAIFNNTFINLKRVYFMKNNKIEFSSFNKMPEWLTIQEAVKKSKTLTNKKNNKERHLP